MLLRTVNRTKKHYKKRQKKSWLHQYRLVVLREDNFEEQFAIIEAQEGELVFLAMTIPDYETMAYNMQELKRYITELKDVVVYYRKVTTADLNSEDSNNTKQ